MKTLMVTVMDKKSGREFDVELPDELDILRLTDDLIQALSGADPMLDWDINQTKLYVPRLNKNLSTDQSLLEEGVWNGDYIYISEC